jgi:hypothetical protein
MRVDQELENRPTGMIGSGHWGVRPEVLRCSGRGGQGRKGQRRKDGGGQEKGAKGRNTRGRAPESRRNPFLKTLSHYLNRSVAIFGRRGVRGVIWPAGVRARRTVVGLAGGSAQGRIEEVG